MTSSPLNLISIDEILADVLINVSDSGLKMASRGWYISQIQQALEELSFDTYFNELDSFEKLPSTLKIIPPKGMFNLIGAYGINGSCDNIQNSENIYYKRNFLTAPTGVGFTANDNYRNDGDPFHTHRGSTATTNLLTVGLQNGILHFSSNCLKFDLIRLVYNGIMTDIGETPVVPTFFRQAVKDWVSVRALKLKCNETVGTNEWNHWKNTLNETKNDLENPYEGSWIKAERRAKRIDKKVKRDMNLYFEKLGY